MQNEQLTTMLNDLIAINNDRIEGYEKAVKDLDHKDPSLENLFMNNAGQSKNYRDRLIGEVRNIGGEAETDTTARGKIYRVWMDVRSAVSPDKPKALLDLCEYGEDAAQKAYEKALEEDVEMEPSIRQIIIEQKEMLKNAHDHIRNLRDQLQAAS